MNIIINYEKFCIMMIINKIYFMYLCNVTVLYRVEENMQLLPRVTSKYHHCIMLYVYCYLVVYFSLICELWLIAEWLKLFCRNTYICEIINIFLKYLKTKRQCLLLRSHILEFEEKMFSTDRILYILWDQSNCQKKIIMTQQVSIENYVD